LNKDGKPDLWVRDSQTGENRILLMDGTTVTKSVKTNWATVADGCNWYPNAVADYDLDGSNDVVWHGPGCASVTIWKMDGPTWVSTAYEPIVNDAFRVVGAGYFGDGAEPKPVWWQANESTLAFWNMMGFTTMDHSKTGLAPGWDVWGVADFDDDGISDLALVQRGTPPDMVTLGVQILTPAVAPYAPSANGDPAPAGTFSDINLPTALGRYSNGHVTAVAPLKSAAPDSPVYSLLEWNGQSFVTTGTLQIPAPNAIKSHETIVGPH
jgi:hypothetical protein